MGKNLMKRIRDGPYESSPLLQRYCSSVSPAPLQTTGPYATVKFHSDYSMNDRGFHITYAAISAGPQCGGALTTDTGTIQSPNYPNAYNHDASCVWTITVSPADTIRFSFTTMDLEHHSNCNYDYVEVRDGPNENADLLGRYCGSTVPSTLISSSNTLYILFRSDSSNAASGFQARWTVENPDSANGCIYDYLENNMFFHGLFLKNNKINLISVLSSIHCLLNFQLHIRNGGSSAAPLLGTYCGDQIPQDVVTTQSMMWIKFVTDGSVSNTGFQATYSVSEEVCGGVLSDNTGTFASPGHPNSYPHGANCTWFLQASPGLVIRLTFNVFSIEEHNIAEGVSHQFLRAPITNGGYMTSPLIGKYCGTTIDNIIRSHSNRLWLRLKTDLSVANRGFKVFYDATSSGCGADLTSPTGGFVSPNYPLPYDHNAECFWTITISRGSKIRLTFTDFNLEPQASCRYDYVQIRNGDSRDSPLIGKYCGTTLPAPITSSGEHLWLNFRSDYSVANNGFRLEYINNGRECIWSITVATGMAVELNISDFDLETHTQCRFDVLEVFNGPDDQSPRLVQICHTQTKPQLITTTGNQMFVRFKSDASVNGRGFSATYRSIAGGCGGNFSTPSSVILSKNYPNDYPPNTVCTWLITVEPQKVVVLTFLNFDVETHSTCRYDYVARKSSQNSCVYDGSDINAPMLIKHCGNSLPVPSIYRSSGNQMYIRMRTDSSVTGCGGLLNAEEDGVITSPNYPENYDRASNCSWLITADHSDDKVTLTFTDINIEPHGTCDHDSVTVYNGDDAGAPVIGSYCGNTVPTPITSYGSSIAERGSFLSPSYPDNYPLDTECVWTFSIAPGNRIMISFSLFNIEEHETCNSDYVEFREADVNGRLIGRFCGTNTPGNITAINGLWMKFRSDSENTGIGFMGQYSTSRLLNKIFSLV
ncbi:hypothetical protein KUTeg_015424, partial [Tegillarca granosa]